MTELITLCGDDCLKCPRYNAKTDDELDAIAELWYRIGWRESVLPAAEMRCGGCSPEKKCTYGLVECTASHNVENFVSSFLNLFGVVFIHYVSLMSVVPFPCPLSQSEDCKRKFKITKYLQ